MNEVSYVFLFPGEYASRKAWNFIGHTRHMGHGAGTSDAGHAGTTDRKAANAEGDLLFGNSLSGILRDCARVRLPGNIVLYCE